MQVVKGTKNSIEKNKQVDIFGNPEPFVVDHIWPLSKGGSNLPENKMFFSHKTNSFKADKTQGTINGIRFAIERVSTKKNEQGEQYLYGRIYIKQGDDWYELVK